MGRPYHGLGRGPQCYAIVLEIGVADAAREGRPLVDNQGGTEKRRRSYRSGARIAKERMAREAPLDAEALAAVEASDVVVVPGAYDHVDRVLEALEMPFTRVGAANRPLGQRDVLRIRDFVASGGSLFTTDWALRHVLEPAFPDTVAYNEHPTADDVVRVEIRDP